MFTVGKNSIGWSGGGSTPPPTTPDASSTVKGITKLSVDPAVASNPIAVGDNDPRMSDASAVNTGLLSSSDWTTFNNKQDALSGTGIVFSTAGVISYIAGTSSQFVKADGSLDSNTYLTTTTGWALAGNTTGNDTSFIGTVDNHDFLLKTNNTTVCYFLKTGLVGIGVSPTAKLHIKGAGSTSGTFTQIWQNSSNVQSLVVRDDGSVYNFGSGSIASNTAFGVGALIANTTGARNAVFGTGATNNTSGSDNVWTGSNAGANNTTGNNNTYVGQAAGQYNSTGGNNVLIGSNAGTGVGSYSNCTIVGAFAGLDATGGNNTFFGNSAGRQNTTGSNNTYLGYGTGDNNTTGSNNIAIGNFAGAVIGGTTQSNTLFIDNDLRANLADLKAKAIIWGVMGASPANQQLTINASLVGGSAALATNATDGFWYVPSCAGTPTGVPTSYTGTIPMVADSTNNKLYIYSSGSWIALN